MVREPRPSREAALAWVRGHCPDLEIQDGGPVGHRARMTFRGRRLEVVVEGPESRDEIAYQVWLRLRQEMGTPVRGHGPGPSGDDIVQEIVQARIAGQHEKADGLEQLLVANRIGASPGALPRGIWQHRPENRDMPPRERQETYLNRDRKVY
jgi:hypothetical protein